MQSEALYQCGMDETKAFALGSGRWYWNMTSAPNRSRCSESCFNSVKSWRIARDEALRSPVPTRSSPEWLGSVTSREPPVRERGRGEKTEKERALARRAPSCRSTIAARRLAIAKGRVRARRARAPGRTRAWRAHSAGRRTGQDHGRGFSSACILNGFAIGDALTF